jgi:hypothetical protein
MVWVRYFGPGRKEIYVIVEELFTFFDLLLPLLSCELLHLLSAEYCMVPVSFTSECHGSFVHKEQ